MYIVTEQLLSLAAAVRVVPPRTRTTRNGNFGDDGDASKIWNNGVVSIRIEISDHESSEVSEMNLIG